MARLRRADCGGPGWTRRRRGSGFQLLDAGGATVEDGEARARVAALVIPPAWRDVWICPDPLGHVQVTGLDAAGRRQYRYHPDWELRRSRRKFDEMLVFAAGLPDLRERVDTDLQPDELTESRVLAAVVRLLDVGFFRIGTEPYARANGTHGLSSMHRGHVKLKGEVLSFDYPAKHGLRRVQHVVDPAVADVVARLKRTRHGHDELFGWRTPAGWRRLRAADVNRHIKDVSGSVEPSAKDFRTWHATVLAAVALAVADGVATDPKARKRAIGRAAEEVAHYLGNTPAVCRSAYIDPRIFDAYTAGSTIAPVVATLRAQANSELALSPHGEAETAVLALLAPG